ncbi:hypothetical protein CBS9595_000436 [Malassezia furfur]|nr:hypothetical protein CBS9595_000436 [Malassezia furfur]
MSGGPESTPRLEEEPSLADGAQASDSSKLKTLLSILKRTVGACPCPRTCSSRWYATVRLTQPNLEYWNYQDRADFFVSIGDYNDPLDRMLATIRLWYVPFLTQHGRVCKPYNSTLGEHFRCRWDVEPVAMNAQGEHVPTAALKSESPSVLRLPGNTAEIGTGPRRVVYLTEQVSHHPPISSYYYDCPEAGMAMVGVDQVSAKFTGTAVRIYPGEFNQGMFITLDERARGAGAAGETYRITHPAGAIFGLFKGSFWPAVTDIATITCTPGAGSNVYYRAIVEYKEEGWLSRPKYAIEGCVYTYEPGTPSASYTALKEVPANRVVVQLQGNWRGLITWTRKGDKTAHPLVNLADLAPCTRDVRPLDAQEPNESRRIWHGVTEAILSQQYAKATKAKQEVEQHQRDLAAQRKQQGVAFVPRYFQPDLSSGRPQLTDAGRAAVEEERRRPASGAPTVA